MSNFDQVQWYYFLKVFSSNVILLFSMKHSDLQMATITRNFHNYL